jgi:hypothetical protein
VLASTVDPAYDPGKPEEGLVSSTLECRSASWAGARRLAAVAAGLTVTLAIGYVSLLAGNADGATRAGLAAGSPAAGPSWKIQRSPSPAGSVGSNLEGVSCTSATACTAIGYYYRRAPEAIATLAEQWNGKTWTVRTGPSVTSLNGVSCASARACTAAGSQQLGSGQLVTLAERWNGDAWTTQATPNPPTPGTSIFSGVSCVSASACTAVGWYAESNPEPTGPFAEAWKGATWTVQTTPSPAGTDWSPLNAVSCTAPGTCIAVGEEQDRAGTYLPLIERESG